MTKNELTNKIWDELRLRCCSTGLKAHRIVMVNKEDIAKVVSKITQQQGIKPCDLIDCGSVSDHRQ